MPLARILLRRGTAAEWAAEDPVLEDGEPGYETDTHLLRIGDGVSTFTNLTEYQGPQGIQGIQGEPGFAPRVEATVTTTNLDPDGS